MIKTTMKKSNMFLLLMLILSSNRVYAVCNRSLDTPTLTQRRECIREDVEGEIQRKHEVDIEVAKIEVEARLQMLSAGDITINNTQESNNDIHTSVRANARSKNSN